MLRGTEVKSCRNGKAQIGEAWVQRHGDELYLLGCHIEEYTEANRFNHSPRRERKLLLHRREIDKIIAALDEHGKLAIPLSLYFLRGRVKLEIAICSGKKSHDRRQEIKERDANREITRTLRRAQKR